MWAEVISATTEQVPVCETQWELTSIRITLERVRPSQI
jgi:hypothetical protein